MSILGSIGIGDKRIIRDNFMKEVVKNFVEVTRKGDNMEYWIFDSGVEKGEKHFCIWATLKNINDFELLCFPNKIHKHIKEPYKSVFEKITSVDGKYVLSLNASSKTFFTKEEEFEYKWIHIDIKFNSKMPLEENPSVGMIFIIKNFDEHKDQYDILEQYIKEQNIKERK